MIDQRFFGPNSCGDDVCNAWKERIELLEPREKEIMEENVKLKLAQMETSILACDPGECTLESMKSMNP